jgi:small ligand-binding sensory domain FIST
VPFAAALSSHPVTAHATGEVVGQVMDDFGAHPDLAVLVATPGHRGALEDACAAVRSVLAPTVLLGWVASEVVTGTGFGAAPAPSELGGARDAVGLWVAHTGPVAPVRTTDLDEPGWAEGGTAAFERRALLVIGAAGAAAPGPPPPDLTVAGAVSDVRGAPIVLDGAAYASGAVGAALGPGVDLTLLVESGRRPIGAPATATRTEGALLIDLDGRPAMSVLEDIARDQVPARDIALINRSLHLEVSAGAGAGAVHTVRGRDGASGALVTDPEVRAGDVVQLWVRDPEEAQARARQVVAGAEGGALAWSTRPSPTGGRRRHDDRDPPPLLACRASAVLGASGAGHGSTDADTIAIGLFREPRVALP